MPIDINSYPDSFWTGIAARHNPETQMGSAPGDCGPVRGQPWSGAWVKSFVINRSVYYVGSCTGQQAIQSAQQNISFTNAIAQGAGAIPGVGGIIGIIDSLFQHHAIAVQNEQAAECQIKQLTAQYIPQIDAAVANGQISAQQGIAAHLQLVNQCKAISAPVAGVGSGGHPCNAGCCFNYFLDCLQDFAETYYMDLTPLSATQPVSPGTWSPTPSNSTQSAIVDGVAPPSGSPFVSTSFPMSYILIALLGLVVVIWLIKT